MKLHPPKPTQRFLSIIDDCEGDSIDIEFHETREAAEARVFAQYARLHRRGTIRCQGTERARVYVAELLARTTL